MTAIPDTQDDAPLVLREEHDGLVTLRLNRPLQFNALSEAMLAALQEAFDTIAQQPHVRCVVLAAEGKAFCAGHDLRQMQATRQLDYYQTLFAQCSRVMQAIQALPVPVIARVHGIATAAGCQLVASCDLAVAGASARFAVSGINVGLFCATPSVALSRNVSPKRAFDMLVTGRFIDADTAADWGLVNETVADTALDEAVARIESRMRKIDGYLNVATSGSLSRPELTVRPKLGAVSASRPPAGAQRDLLRGAQRVRVAVLAA